LIWAAGIYHHIQFVALLILPFLGAVHHLNPPVGRLNPKSQQHVASNDMTNVDSTSFTFRLPVCGCEVVRVCVEMCELCILFGE